MGSYKKVGYTGPVPGEGAPAQPLRYLCRNLQEEENQRLAHKLHDRVRLLRSLSIEIGAEVRYQNRFLGSLDDDLERTGGVLDKALGRVAQLVRNPQYFYFVYIALFTLACLATVWCVVRFR